MPQREGRTVTGPIIASGFVSGWARASSTLPGKDDSPGWLSPSHLPLSGVRSGQRAQAPVAIAACDDVITGAIGYIDTRHENVKVW